MNDRHRLRWTPGPETLVDLPPQITRCFIPTPKGRLEILVAQPLKADSRKKALIFQHGGFGSAAVWIPFLTFFSQEHGYPCYAVSLRGHGASWKPGFFEMVFRSGKAAMAQDLGYAFAWVEGYEAGHGHSQVTCDDIVLIGHSAGGGLSQYFLSRNLGTVGGLVIIAGFPCFGGLPVYINWFKLDPWFLPRFYIRDLWHPRSPLSSTTLVHRAFFSPLFPTSGVQEFERLMPEYESLLWPSGMMLPFIRVQNVLKNIVGWRQHQQRLMVIAGEKDTLMGVPLMRKMAVQYRQSFASLLKKWFFGEEADIVADGAAQEEAHEGVESARNGVRFAIVRGSGHQIQNDLQWKECANQILDFLGKL